MGRYITQSDVETVFGRENVIKWSNLDNRIDRATADTDRVDAAITWAENYLDDQLRASKYQIPLTHTDGSSDLTTIQHIAARYAGVRLHQARGVADYDEEELDSISRHMREAKTDVGAIQAGTIELNAQTKTSGSTGPSIVFNSGDGRIVF